MKKIILIFMLATLIYGQDATRKTIRNFVTAKPTSITETGLTAKYNMLLSGSQVLSDISGNGENGTAVNVDYTFRYMDFDGASSLVTLGDLENVKSIEFQIRLNSTTEKIMEGAANDKLIHASGGTLTYPDFDTSYVNGVGGNTITDQWSHVVIVSDTNVDFSATTLALNNATYGNFQMKDLGFYSITLTESQAIAKYNKTIELQLLETFSYSSTLASNRNWITGSGQYEVETVDDSEQVVNGTDNANWNMSGTGSIADANGVKLVADGANDNAQLPTNLIDGKAYSLTYEVLEVTLDDNWTFNTGGVIGTNLTLEKSIGIHSFVFIADISSQFFFFNTAGANTDGTYVLFNLTSVTEVTSPTVTNGSQYFNCTSAGTIAIQSSTSYGTWEFDLLKGGEENTITIKFIGTNTDAYTSDSENYIIQIPTSERLGLFKGSGASTLFFTATDFFSNNEWHHVTATRTTDNEFTAYLDGVLVDVTGGSGTNPVTDNTYTSSNFIVLDLDVGDKVANFKITDGVIK